jgi:hypothetical protein
MPLHSVQSMILSTGPVSEHHVVPASHCFVKKVALTFLAQRELHEDGEEKEVVSTQWHGEEEYCMEEGV